VNRAEARAITQLGFLGPVWVLHLTLLRASRQRRERRKPATNNDATQSRKPSLRTAWYCHAKAVPV